MFRYARANFSMIFAVLVLSVNPVYAQVTFNSKNYALSHAPQSAVSADLNGDGKPDLVIASQTGGTVAVLLNNGDGTFSPELDFPAVPNFFNAIAVGDFNGDSKPDVIALESGSSPSSSQTLYVLLGNGDGTLQAPISTSLAASPLGGFLSFPPEIGDINGDGKTDVVLANDLGAVSLLSNGDGTFSMGSQTLFPVISGVVYFLIADVNGDAKLDLVVSAIDISNNGVIFSALGNGDGTFQSPTPASQELGFWSFRLITADFRHTGNIDLVGTSYQEESCPFGVCTPDGPPGALALLPNEGNASFGADQLQSGNYGLSSSGDFDGDGNLDIVVFGQASHKDPRAASVVMLGDGHGGFPAQTAISFGVPASVLSVDLNGDGLSDLVVLNPNLQVALNTTPSFSLTASDSNPSVHPGESANLTINTSQQNGFSGTVALSCSSPSLAGINCSVSPATVTPGGTSTLTVTTMGTSAALTESVVRFRWTYAFWLPLGAFVFYKRSWGKQAGLALILFCVTSLTACGGSSTSTKSQATAAGTYKVSITGVSGSLQRSTVVSLIVQ